MTMKLPDLPGGGYTYMLGIGLLATAALGILKKFEVGYETEFEAGNYELESEFEFEIEREKKRKHKRNRGGRN